MEKIQKLIYNFSTIHPVNINEKWGATFHFLPFKDEKQHFRVVYTLPYNSRTNTVPDFFCQFWMSRGELYSISKYEQNAWGSLTPLVPP